MSLYQSGKTLSSTFDRAIGIALRKLPAVFPFTKKALSLSGHFSKNAACAAAYAQLYSRLQNGEQVPLDQLQPVVKLLLARSDELFQSGSSGHALRLADWALQLSYHPNIHYGDQPSPRAVNAEEFFAPYRSSLVGNKLLFELDPPVSSDSRKRRGSKNKSPLHLLVVSHSSWSFVDRVIDGLPKDGSIEVRKVDISSLPAAQRPGYRQVIQARWEFSQTHKLMEVPPALRSDFEWADTIFVEWATYPLAWLTFMDMSPYNVRLVARLHRYEGNTPYPQLMRAEALDEICFVSAHVRNMICAAAPRIKQARKVRLIHNMHDLHAFTKIPHTGSPFDLVMVQWAPPVKDVNFALDVLEILLQHDKRYHLTLIGSGLGNDSQSALTQWEVSTAKRIAQFGDAVQQLGYRKDIPGLLADAGFLLSTSKVEGTHESVAEAAASGCIPIVRNWIESAPWGGAGTVYPQDWVISTPEEAAEKILSLSQDDRFSQTSCNVQKCILKLRDPETTLSDYLEVIGY